MKAEKCFTTTRVRRRNNEVSVMKKLVVDELEFCCIHKFISETKKYSAKKIAAALGVGDGTISYWRSKIANGSLVRCLRCRQFHIYLELKTTAFGKPYFSRSSTRCTGADDDMIRNFSGVRRARPSSRGRVR